MKVVGSPKTTTMSGATPEKDRGRGHGRRPRHSEAPPTGVLTGVLGELAFFYGACWLHYRSAPQRPEEEACSRW